MLNPKTNPVEVRIKPRQGRRASERPISSIREFACASMVIPVKVKKSTGFFVLKTFLHLFITSNKQVEGKC